MISWDSRRRFRRSSSSLPHRSRSPRRPRCLQDLARLAEAGRQEGDHGIGGVGQLTRNIASTCGAPGLDGGKYMKNIGKYRKIEENVADFMGFRADC